MQRLPRFHRGFSIGVLSVVLVATMAVAGAPVALAAGGADAAHSASQARKKAHQRKRKHRRARKHRAKVHGPVVLAPGVTESPNGWIHYSPLSAGPAVQSEETVRFQGRPAPSGGGCIIEKPSSMPPGGQELIREEIAYNPDTCESVYLERLIGAPTGSGGVHSRVVPGDSGTIRYATGHNMQLWVDPVGLTISGLSLDLSWPLYGNKGRWSAVPYSYKFALDGWKTGTVTRDLVKASKEGEQPGEKMWGSAQAGAPAGGRRATAYRRFENIDFYKAVRSAKLGWLCPEGDDDVDQDGKTDWTVFTHEVQVTGYHNGKMGTWQYNTKTGPCSWMVHDREKVGWGLKRNNFPFEFKDEIGNKIIHLGRGFTEPAEALISDESTAPVPYDLLATETAPTALRLEGGVNPRGISTNWWAQCGTTAAYGMWASGQVNIGSGTSSVPVAVTVPNLQPNTTYHCRLVTLNVQGEAAFSADEEFTTPPVPVPPEARTEGVTGVDLHQATLQGSVDPNGWVTRYLFQFGTTATWGADGPEESAGGGGDFVPVGTTITGLAEGTTYHYRLVARNAAGEYSYGEDRAFTTQKLPLSSSRWAVASGGTANNPNQWVYSTGANGQIWQRNWFGTKWNAAQATSQPAAPGTGPTALAYGGSNPSNPSQSVYYHGSDHQIWQWFWNGSSSSNGVLSGGETVAANTSPSALASGLDPNSPNQWVYYTGSNGQIWQWNWFGTKWTNAQATTQPAAPGTSPTAIAVGGVTANNPYQAVYYHGSDHQIWQWFWNGSGSTNGALSGGQPVAANTSPTAIASGGGLNSPQYNNPNQWIYYTGANGQIWQWNWFGTKWTNAQATTQPAASGTSPTAAAYGGTANNPYQVVYYIGPDHRIWQWFWNGSSSSNGALPVGQPAAFDTNPTVITYGGTPNNPYQAIYYKGMDGQMWQWFWNGSTWKNGAF